MFAKNLLAQKRILITGGGTGLGKSAALAYAYHGADLVILGRRLEVLEQTAQEIRSATGREVECISCDVRDADKVEQGIAKIFEKGPLHGLMNNAAGNFIARTESLSARAVDAVLNIVLHGTAYVTLACAKRWLKEPRPREAFSVLNVVTTYAETGSGYVVPSAMAKAGVVAMTRSLASEWGPRGIRMNGIAPGPIPTEGAWERLMPDADFAEKAMREKIPLRRFGTHDEFANACLFLMSGASSFVNGEILTMDGGEWLQGAGEFNLLEKLSDQDWAKMAERGRASK